MPKGLKKDFPFYAKVEDVLIQGQVDLGRLTPKTFNSFIKTKHGPDANPEDYIILNVLSIGLDHVPDHGGPVAEEA